MKKSIFILSLLIACSTALTAQNDSQHLGLEIGYNRPLLRDKAYGYTKYQTTTLNGMRVGLFYDATLVKGFGLRMGVNFSMGSYTSKWISLNSFSTYPQTRTRTMLQNITVPIEWQYKFLIAKETYLILYTGPTFEYSFKYNNTNYQREINGDITSKVYNKFDYDNDKDGIKDYSPFNLQWGVGAGFQFQRYYVRGGYDFGIINGYRDRYYNVSADEAVAVKARNDSWHISLGIYFLNF